MTDKEQIKCKYMFQDKEKFDGKPYCTCFCELCEDLPLCDDNCQIYEDYKQLARKTQECEELKEYIQEREVWGDHCEFCKHNDKENCHLNIILDNLKTINSYRKALEEIKKVCIKDTREFADGTTVRYDALDDILDIINKADFGKSEHSETRPDESCVEPVEPPIIQEAKGEE